MFLYNSDVKKQKITEDISDKIHSLISVKTFTWQDISNALDNVYTLNQIQYHVRKYYPDLKSNIVKEYSRGGSKIEYLLKQIFPANKVSAEVHLGSKLRADFVVGSPYNVAFEFDGSQHSTYSSHFHAGRHEFENAQARDQHKDFLCKQRGLSLVRISQLAIDLPTLKNLIEKVGYGSGNIEPEFLTHKEKHKMQQEKQRLKVKQLKKENPYVNPNAEALKEKQREYRKAQYQRQKEWLKQNKK